MTEIKPNSHKYKEEQRAREKKNPVVKNKVRRKQKSGLAKFKDGLINEDIPNLKDYVIFDLAIPYLMNTLGDILNDTIDTVFHKGTRGGSRTRRTNTYVSYRDYGSRNSNRTRVSTPVYAPTRRTGYDFDDIVISTAQEAEDVLQQMVDTIGKYGIVTVNDYYDFVGEVGNPCDANYGWSSLRTADIVRVRDGYIIKLPKPKPIEY